MAKSTNFLLTTLGALGLAATGVTAAGTAEAYDSVGEFFAHIGASVRAGEGAGGEAAGQ